MPRLTLLLGPPGSGKTTLLKALAGVLEKDLRVIGQILGLDICADIMVGDVMRRGISGGQKKRVTTWEMLFGPAKEVTSRKDQEQYWYKKNEPYHYVSVPEMPSVMESLIWTILTYYTIGFTPDATRFLCQLLAYVGVNQIALSLFRFIAAVSRIQVVSNSLGTFTILLVLLLGGFIVAKDDIVSWMKWGYYISPLMYGQNAIAVNEFLDERWNDPNTDTRIDQPTVGKVLLASRGMFVDGYMYWICVFVLFAYSIFLNILFILALTYLNPFGSSKSVVDIDVNTKKKNKSIDRSSASKAPLNKDMGVRNTPSFTSDKDNRRGMLLPFKPLSLAFEHVNYYVDMPPEMKSQGIIENRLQLLRDVSGAFRPGVLTALVGVSGAGKDHVDCAHIKFESWKILY
ncbi:hypothetical protein POM88_015858 [Heracleum sosnowskyi]|uniref:ABC transporter domain-containing protein n=1 Tax=Heracleum sosnowskyi TaxID=360622 RepID=A0AAD8IL11_9APIA|nr:hypothetical protein POM88_015858 [Heracleum sosnowskyi]